MVKKAAKLPPLSEGQLEIMNLVWDRGEVTVADVWKTLSERRGVARNTVQTMIARLAEKGWLRHRAVGNSYVYSAAVPRDATREQMVRRLVDAAFGGSVEGLILTLLEDRGLSQDEAARIRAMIEQAEKQRVRKEP